MRSDRGLRRRVGPGTGATAMGFGNRTKDQSVFFDYPDSSTNLSDNSDFFGGTPDRKLAKPQCRPPEALIRSPVSHAAPSDARKTMTGAISSGLPNLAPSGVADAPTFPASLPTNPISLLPSVSTRPGATTLTRMFRGPSSLANAIVRVSTAPLVAE